MRTAYNLGLWAEARCRASLALQGYRIVASRYKTPVGEIDIIAMRDDVLAFVEVKARPDLGQAAEAVSLRQKKRIVRAAQHFALKHGAKFARCNWRFDAMLVAPWRWPRHIESAWREDEVALCGSGMSWRR
ncbi:MAG: YraN family protein [Bdellovibrionales bacterium]